jgi:hypothetical protein
MPSGGQVTVYVQIPALSQFIPIAVTLTDRFGELVQKILTKAQIPERVAGFHLYALSDNFTAFPDDAPCTPLFMKTYRLFVLQAGASQSVTVIFEGRSAQIDYPERFSVSSLLSVASQVFNISTADESLVAFDPATLLLLSVEAETFPPTIILKRFHLYSPELAFTATADLGEARFSLYPLPKAILAEPVKKLLSTIQGLLRRFRDKPLEFAELSEDRLKELLKPQPEGPEITTGEQNSLLFLLFGTNEKPMVPEVLHDRILRLMQEPSPVKKFDDLWCILVLLPLQTHCFLSEISQLYGGISRSSRTGCT